MGKRNVPHLVQAQQALVCLWLVSEMLQCLKYHDIFPQSVSRRVFLSFIILWGSVSADFDCFTAKLRGGGIDRKVRNRQKDLSLFLFLFVLSY